MSPVPACVAATAPAPAARPALLRPVQHRVSVHGVVSSGSIAVGRLQRRQRGGRASSEPQDAQRVPTSFSRLGGHAADPELVEVLELATDDELEDIYRLLTGRSLFSPLIKSIVAEREESVTAAHGGRDVLIHRIDQRLRFLAADSAATLKGRWPNYRAVLLMIRDKLDIRCPSTLLTNELEAEIFLHLLEKHSDAVDVDVDREAAQQAQAAAAYADQGDGGAAAHAHQQASGRRRGGPGALLQRLLAPLKLGSEEVVPALAKLSSAVAVSNLQQTVMQRLGLQLVRRHVQYESALHLALSAGAKSAQGRMAVQAAKEGITAAASRYAAARGVLSVLGPVMWASTAFELFMVSIGTDYARVVKAVFTLAQIRLLRTYGFSNASGGGSLDGSSGQGTGISS